MPVLDFKEIPEAHIPSGKQDVFEQFAADVLRALGYEVVDPPGRGPDLGKDLVVIERRKGIGRETAVRWLVSCKHKAHSSRAVGLEDEINLIERVEGHACQGFMGFYSTLPSASLIGRLQQLNPKFEFQIFDCETIGHHLLCSTFGLQVARRYFSDSMKTWAKEHPEPAKIFEDNNSLLCDHCGRNLLNPPQGIYAVWRRHRNGARRRHILDIHWSCKGLCDQRASGEIEEKHSPAIILSAWEDIPDLCIPIVYLKYVIGHLNGIRAGTNWADDAFEKFKTLLIAVYPFVVRDASSAESETIVRLRSMPPFMGGLGF